MHQHDAKKVQEWLERILGHEGGYSNDPQDPGGETRWGISKRAYPQLDIKNLSVAQAADIYLRDYLAPLRADRYPDGVAFQIFDFAVNSGVGTAIKKFQRAVGVADDGVAGPQTLAAAETLSEAQTIMLVLAERLEFMASLSTFERFGRGWARRLAKNLRFGAVDIG